ncbi:putative arabinose-5-phosphate isomerase [Tetraselmis virus 1]|uniref:Putative arabinose-5-phosphate isomerase n=1 Tax=Tetraselmis virus 1 TaxID=2060617 RepID=A0A2P0VNK5_9VIRU|nr:putative arabinose-5-phosphate isomerase [Tetraselmis virus 1]AUF82485.1 putative arabinose-5-phosphate isomerase [Tetraselmis virus 1]
MSSEIGELFKQQSKLVSDCLNLIDINQVSEFCDECLRCKGTVFFSGVGKSGFVANKIAQTWVSFGIHASPLSVIDAMHGDLGAVDSASVVVLISKSGESEEIIRIVPFIRKKGASVVAVTCKRDSTLESICDKSIVLPLEKELCLFNLAPVTSASIQMLFGDTIAVYLMEKRGTSLKEYAKNHPGGSIGKRITLEVGDVMYKNKLPIITPECTVCDAMMVVSSGGHGCVMVVDNMTNMKLEGVFTDGDLRRGLISDGPSFFEWPVGAVMTRDPRSTHPERKAYDAMLEMRDTSHRKVMFFPVISNDKVVGLCMLNKLASLGL